MIHDPQADDLDLTTVEAIGRLIRITVLITSGLIILQALGFLSRGFWPSVGLGHRGWFAAKTYYQIFCGF